MEAKQIKFKDGAVDDYGEECEYGGLLIDNLIICGCCGGIIEVKDVGWENITLLPWINIDEEIRGD